MRLPLQVKLAGTEANLLRVDDVLEQLAQQLSVLTRQAKQAARYRELSEELRKSEGMLLWRRWRDARDRRQGEDALKFIHAREWRGGRPATLEGLAGSLGLSSRRAVALVRRLEARGLQRLEVAADEQGERMAVPDDLRHLSDRAD